MDYIGGLSTSFSQTWSSTFDWKVWRTSIACLSCYSHSLVVRSSPWGYDRSQAVSPTSRQPQLNVRRCLFWKWCALCTWFDQCWLWKWPVGGRVMCSRKKQMPQSDYSWLRKFVHHLCFYCLCLSWPRLGSHSPLWRSLNAGIGLRWNLKHRCSPTILARCCLQYFWQRPMSSSDFFGLLTVQEPWSGTTWEYWYGRK